MRPYYDHAGITIYHGDCRDILPRLLPGSMDFVLTDPPYAVRSDREWDRFASNAEFTAFTGMWLQEALRIAPAAAVFFGFSKIHCLLDAADDVGAILRRGLVWRKPPGSQYSGASMDGFWFDFEMIAVFGEPRKVEKPRMRFSVLDYRTVTNQEHGCEKPVGLLSTLIEHYVPAGGTVLDPFLGTGSTLRAAKDMGRRAIGIEADEKYCEVATRRLGQEVLFPAPTAPLTPLDCTDTSVTM